MVGVTLKHVREGEKVFMLRIWQYLTYKGHFYPAENECVFRTFTYDFESFGRFQRVVTWQLQLYAVASLLSAGMF